MRRLLYAASVLVFLAGFQLFILTEQTDKYFAWTISPPFITAAFLGAAYWSSVPLELIAARQKAWAKARIAIPSVWLFTTLTLAVTLLHSDRFHFASPDVLPKTAAWFWLAIYASVPLALLLAVLAERRLQGGDPPRSSPYPPWLRVILPVQGVGMLVTGIALLVAPSTTLTVWPWTLTVLTARAIGAWLTAIGVGGIHAVFENDLARVRPLGSGYSSFGILELIAIIRYPGDVNWSLPAAWIYLTFLITILPLGLYCWFAKHRLSSKIS